MQYFKATRTLDITYGGEKENLIIKHFFDSDWIGNYASRKSTFRFIFMLNGSSVSWCSKKQVTMTLSSTEAEYMAITFAAKKVI